MRILCNEGVHGPCRSLSAAGIVQCIRLQQYRHVTFIGVTMIAFRIVLGDACCIISSLKDEKFILTLVHAYQIDCRRNTSDLSTYVSDF
jgi:hypothetical protein